MADREVTTKYILQGDPSGMVAAADRAKSAVKDMADQSSRGTQKLTGDFDLLSLATSRFSGVLGGIGLAAVVSQLHAAGTASERFRNSFEASTGSVHKGAAEYAYARAEAMRLGLDLQTTADSYMKLTASSKGTNLEGEKTRQIFSAVAGASRSLELSSEQSSGALMAIQQMMSKGTVQAEELRGQLGERLPGAFQIAARSMGVSTAELGKMLEKGEVISDDFLPRFAAELEKTFPAGEKAMAGMTAETERLKTAWFELKTTVMESGGEGLFASTASGVAALTAEFTALLKTLDKIGGKLPFGAVTLGSAAAGAAYGAPAGPLGMALGGLGGAAVGVAGTAFTGKYSGAVDKYGRTYPALNKVERDLAAPDFSARFGITNDRLYRPQEPERTVDFGATLTRDNQPTAAETAAARRTGAAQNSASAAQLEENAYINLYNTLQDKINEHNPLLNKEQQEMLKLRIEYDNHILRFPAYRKELEQNYQAEFEQLALKQKLIRGNRELALSTKELEDQNKDSDILSLAPARFGMAANKVGDGLSVGSRYSKSGRFSLMGAGPNTVPQYDQSSSAEKERLEAERHSEEMLRIEERFNQQMMTSKMGMAEQSLALLQQTASEGSGIAIAALVAQRALAVSQIIINTNAAASAALQAPPVGLGPIAGQGLAAEITATGYLNAGLTGAIGIAQVVQEVGKREFGGPVQAGRPYIVGERRPELFVPRENGTILPSVPGGGNTIVINQSFTVTGIGAELTQNMKAIANQAKESAKAEILSSMNRGGTFAKASGRI